MKITVLIENTREENSLLIAEHGLSLWIEYRGHNYLLDAGSTKAIFSNAEQLGIDLAKTDVCLLSHGHYDHSGGFYEVLKKNENLKLYGAASIARAYFSSAGKPMHYIGIPAELGMLLKEHFCPITSVTEIAPGVWVVPHSTPGLECIGAAKHLYQKKGESFFPDDFTHEVTYVFEEEDGLVLFNSCSHGGAETILREVKAQFPEKKILAFLGGLHMKGSSQGQETCTFTESEIDSLCTRFREYGTAKVYPGHCTGTVGFEKIRARIPDAAKRLTTGKRIEIGEE